MYLCVCVGWVWVWVCEGWVWVWVVCTCARSARMLLANATPGALKNELCVWCSAVSV